MAVFMEKHRKQIFWLILAAAFITIFIYNFLTPYLSDDYFYACEVRQAESFWDLIKQQYGEYLSNSGRVVGQFNVRLSLVFDKQVFNLVNSGMFVILVLLMYANIRRKKSMIYLYFCLLSPFYGSLLLISDRQCFGFVAPVIICGEVYLFWDLSHFTDIF